MEQPRNVLVLGATSSVATDLCRLLAARGDRLTLVARNGEKLARIAGDLGASAVRTAALDFTHHERLAEVMRSLLTETAFDLVVVAHGELGDQRASERDLAEFERALAVNFTSVVAALLPVIDDFERRRTGHIAVISSVAGLRGRPRNYTYGAAKGALLLYLQGVRSRLYPSVTVTTILLGPVDTPMTTTHEKNWTFSSSRDAARGILRAIERRAGDAFVPGWFRYVMWLVRTLPEALFQRVRAFSAPPEVP